VLAAGVGMAVLQLAPFKRSEAPRQR